ncbi:hypothetical protein CIPAW_16G011700 [Carya illinoinensis]|uniref:Uncharacterized protein n=1 Tax=Carya illinoinensis TaxID=32201 RepID=A0A8T1N1F6_CARIL|nr:hypothetical protein CIPAW_16G011700 [Carya illinoinensis]
MGENMGVCPVCRKVFHSEDIEHLLGLVDSHSSQLLKSQAMELAKSIEKDDGVAATIDAFHRQFPPELPLPTAFLEKDGQPNPLQ